MGLPNEIIAGLIGGKKQYQIERSLRFNDNDSAYLSRTPGSAGNRKTWTWSGWVKRGNLGIQQHLFIQGADDNNLTLIRFLAQDTLQFAHDDASSPTDSVVTTAVFRDPSAWYHIVVAVDTTQATASDRVKMYVNGVQITAFGTANYPTLNFDTDVNTTAIAYIGRRHGGFYLDGYMAEVHFIDGTALTPSSFGETDISTGTWIPKKYTGTYGTNGFYLPFSDNTSTTTLGDDSSGNNNDWTLNNFSVTAGAGNDSLEDTPTNNYATVNPLKNDASITLANGNLDVTLANDSNGRSCAATIAVSAGKWYWEATISSDSANRAGLGIATPTTSTADFTGTYATGYFYSGETGNKWNNNSSSAYGATFTATDIIGVALDLDAGELTFYKNGTTQGLAFSGLSGEFVPRFDNGGNVAASNVVYNVNFGQRHFAYTPPTGFKALNTKNLPTPSIKNPSKYMNITTWTGNGNTRSITGIGFQPDLVWTKSRSNAEDHKLVDSSRTAGRALESNTTDDEIIESGISSFDSDGFTIDGATDAGYNTNTYTYVGWTWKKGIVPGFDIVTYTGNGTARTIPHSLGIAPHFMIVKARSTAGTNQGWPVYHRNNTTAPETDYLLLNSAAATADLDTIWNDTAPTSSVFSVGTNALVNTNNDTYVAYLFTEISGFSRFGSYTGNGSTDGPFVWCGFRPRYLLIKEVSGTNAATASWTIFDSSRAISNETNNRLFAQLTDAEVITNVVGIDFLSNGFKHRVSNFNVNESSGTYIFAAFAEHPFKYSRAR